MDLRQRALVVYSGAAILAMAVAILLAEWALGMQNILMVYAAFVVPALFAVAVVFYVSDRWIIAPLHNLVDDIEAVSRGDLDVEIGGAVQERDDEIGRLAAAFHRMLKSFKIARQSTAPILEEEKRRLQEALAQREAILDAAQSGVLVVDKKGNVVTFNNRFSEIWELSDEGMDTESDEDLLQEALEQLEHPDAFYQRVQEVYETGEADHTILRFTDGRIIERYGRPQTVNGERIGYVWTFRDITEQEEQQKRLERLNERFKLANTVTGEVIWDLNVETDAVWRSENYERIFGYAQRQETLDEAADRIHADDRDTVIESLQTAINSDADRWEKEYRYRTADGEYITVRDRAIIVRDDAGEADRVIGAMLDISEQVAHADELDERFEYAAKATDTVIWDWNMETDVLVRSENFYDMYGYNEDETADTWEACQEEIHPDDRERVDQAIQEAIRSGENDWYLEYRYERGDGSYVRVANQGYILRDEDGEACRVIGSTRMLDGEAE